MDLENKTKQQLNGMLLARSNKCRNCDVSSDNGCYYERCSVYREIQEIKQIRRK